MNYTNAGPGGAMLFAAAAVFAAALILLLLFGKRFRTARGSVGEPVTGGMNGTELIRLADKYLAVNGNQYSVVIMELDNYRQLLQTFGDEKTHHVLKYIHNSLKTNLGGTEPAARISGGRFCFLMKSRKLDVIRARLTRFFDSVNAFNRNESIPYMLQLRFGVYVPLSSGNSVEEIQETLLEKLENSKERLIIYREEAKEPASRNWELLRQMEKSLNNGDFVLYMQPKVRLSDNRIVGAEALIRWKHPQRGLLTPEMFIPILEEYHMISRFDLHLFEQVCRRMAIWAKEGKVVCPVSLNLSHDTIRQKSFLEPYIQLAEKHAVAPENIEFELSKAIQQLELSVVEQLVQTIRDAGFRCALDNFGGRAVHLHLLRDLGVDTVKLDPGFFSVENNNRRNRFVVEGIIKIASQMQIRTVATGIDNPSQVQYLKQAGCDMVQGFHYFQPMSADEFAATVYSKDELRYVEESKHSSGHNPISAAPNASGNIVMFSLLTASDRMVFSNIFSPILVGQHTVNDAFSMLRHSELIHENDRNDFFHLLERCAKENGWVENAIRFYTAKGRYEWLEVHLHKEYFPAAGEMVISGTLINMAGWKNELDRWKEKANRDALTGLYNREYFEQTANSFIKKNSSSNAAVVFVDIDDFKNVNDTMGHTVGDDVICWFAKRILGAFRHTDVVARYGGDEFVVFVHGISRDELTKRLEYLCDDFRVPYRNRDIECPVSCSIGAAMFPEDGGSYLELLDCADSALYEAKRCGKNRFVLYRPDIATAEKL